MIEIVHAEERIYQAPTPKGFITLSVQLDNKTVDLLWKYLWKKLQHDIMYHVKMYKHYQTARRKKTLTCGGSREGGVKGS